MPVEPHEVKERKTRIAGLDERAPLFQGLVRGMLPAYLLSLLTERSLHGTDMIRALGHMSDGVWKPSPGSVYPVLRKLEADGLISGRWQRGQAAPKRVYRLTRRGRDLLPALRRSLVSELEAARAIIDRHLSAFAGHGWGSDDDER